MPGLQVWADRRSQAFEDHPGFASGDPDQGVHLLPEGRRFGPSPAPPVPYVREWGLGLALEDLRKVVLKRAGAAGAR